MDKFQLWGMSFFPSILLPSPHQSLFLYFQGVFLIHLVLPGEERKEEDDRSRGASCPRSKEANWATLWPVT